MDIDWHFSIGWMIFGLILVAIGTIMVTKYQFIADNAASGVNSYDRVKLVGMIIIGIGLVITMNLHTLLLSLLVSVVFKGF